MAHYPKILQTGGSGTSGTSGNTGTSGTSGSTTFASSCFKWNFLGGNPPSLYPNAGQMTMNSFVSAAIDTIFIQKSDADGTDQTLWLQSWDDSGSYGYITITGLTSGAFVTGLITAIDYTHGGSPYYGFTPEIDFTNLSDSGTNFTIGEDVVICFVMNGGPGTAGMSGTSGTSGSSGAGVANYYASYSDSTTQIVSAANTPTVITYNTTEIQNGFTLVSNSRITAQYNGIYEFGYSLQIEKTSGGSATDVDIFVRKNGADIVRTDSILGLANNNAKQLPYVSLIVEMNQNDYLELVFASSSNHVQITAVPLQTSPYAHPAAPSIIVNIKNIGVAAVAYTSTSGTSGGIGSSGTSAPYPSTNLFNYYNFI